MVAAGELCCLSDNSGCQYQILCHVILISRYRRLLDLTLAITMYYYEFWLDSSSVHLGKNDGQIFLRAGYTQQTVA